MLRNMCHTTILQRLFYVLTPVLFLCSLLCFVSANAAEVSAVDRLKVEAFRYYTGTGTRVNYAKALTLYKKAAILGDAEAQFILGGMLFRGLGTDSNEKEAFKWFLKAAEQGKSTPRSQAILGAMYLRGVGVPQNYKEALHWHTMGAEGGDSQSLNELAYMYYNGLGTKQDFEKAAQWYHDAALEGDAQAQYNLGLMYSTGTGLEQDRTMAYAWYSVAAGNGNTTATAARNSLMPLLSWEELNASQEKAMQLYKEIERRKEEKSGLNPFPQPSQTP